LTDKHQQAREALVSTAALAGAAQALGIAKSTLQSRLEKAKEFESAATELQIHEQSAMQRLRGLMGVVA
jgi:hypothetical protein